MKKIAGLILAGGQSTRMGTDKMYLKYKNKPFIEHTMEALGGCEAIYVSLNQRQNYTREGITVIRDEQESIGPIGGLAAALKVIPHDYIWVCGCDMPYLTKALVDYTLGYITSERYDAYLLRTSEGRIHPLAGIYHKRVREQVENQIASQNYKLMDLIGKLKVKIIDLQYTIFEKQDILANINTPDAYKRIQPVKVFAVSGVKNSGKTTIVIGLVEALTQRGLKVGTLKHDGHLFEADCKGTDSYKHKQAGAARTLVFDTQKFCLVQDQKEATPEELLNYFKGIDVVILEGLKHSHYPKIEVVREAISTQPVCDEETVLAYVTDCKWQTTKPCYKLTDLEGLTQFITRYLNRKE